MRLFFYLLLLVTLTACKPTAQQNAEQLLEANKKELIFVTHNGPTTYFLNGENQASGIEYDLATLFVKDYAPEYKIKFLLVNSVSEVIPSLLKGNAQIAAANLTVTHLRQELVQFSKPYQETQQQLIFNNEINTQPKDFDGLIGKKIAVPIGTSYAERLAQLQEKTQNYTGRQLKK
jgi:membrane-bound lytic murein transglycosylase F